MADRIEHFLAYCIVTGRTNLSAEEKARLQSLADRWIRAQDRVRARITGALGIELEVDGVIVSVEDNGRATIKLDSPIEIVSTGGVTGVADEIMVEDTQIAKIPSEPAPAPTA